MSSLSVRLNNRFTICHLPFAICHFLIHIVSLAPSILNGGFNFQVQLPERQGRGLEKPGASAERCEARRPWNSTRRLESAESAPSIL